MGLGGELGLGRSLAGDDEFALIAAGSTVRWDPEVGGGALSFSADLHYRCTFDLVSGAVGTGIPADEMFSGFVLFIGAGWAW